MINDLEILVINIENRLIGLDCVEIKRVIYQTKNVEKKNFMDEYRKKENFFNLSVIMNLKTQKGDNSFIFTTMKDGTEILISVPAISGIIKTNISSILVIPEFLRKKQDPFFIWGFLENEGKLISLATFSFFYRGKNG